MNDARISNPRRARAWHGAALWAVAALVAGCGGSGGANDGDAAPVNGAPPPAQVTTGTLAVMLTDRPTDEIREINITLTEVLVLGDDDGQQILYSGDPQEINLLDLRNYSKPIALGEIDIGNYNKIRLRISNLELVFHDPDRPPEYPPLPANGKIDLLDQDGFEILPGRTLLAQIDMDANNSLKLTQTGNGQYRFRPVVKVQFSYDGADDKLVRLEGVVDELSADVAGKFELCAIDALDSCIDVNTGDMTSFFGDDGTPTPSGFDDVQPGQTAVVTGRYREEVEEDDMGESGADIDVELDAVVVQLGGNTSRVTGRVLTAPADDRFLIVEFPGDPMNDPSQLAVALQDGTRIFRMTDEIDAAAIEVGDTVEVEGVLVTPDGATDPDEILAAILFLSPDDRDQLSGEIAADTVDPDARTFGVLTMTDPVCVEVLDAAVITDVNTVTSEVTTGALFADVIEAGKNVDVFGSAPDPAITDSCFVAEEVIVETAVPPASE